MRKTEIVCRELLESREQRLTQLGLSRQLGFSLSTVHNALRPLVKMGAVEILPRGLKVRDREKILLSWASRRDLQKDILYATRAGMTPSEIEKSVPASAVYTAFSAVKFAFGSVPADYSEVYLYCPALEAVKKRFPQQKGPPNLVVLRADERLLGLAKENIAPLSQVFVDLWNLKEWYAKEFVRELKERMA